MCLLRVEARRLDLELLNRVSRWYEGHAISAAPVIIRIRHTVEREFVASRSGHAVGDEVRATVVVERSREFQIADVADARRQTHQRKWIPIRKRQLRDAPPIDHLPGGSRVCLQRLFSGYVNGLRHAADFERQVES